VLFARNTEKLFSDVAPHFLSAHDLPSNITGAPVSCKEYRSLISAIVVAVCDREEGRSEGREGWGGQDMRRDQGGGMKKSMSVSLCEFVSL